LGTAVRINPINYIVTREQLGIAVRINPTHYIITRGALGNSGKKKPNTLYHPKRSSWEQW
jgi:hypothetical protein